MADQFEALSYRLQCPEVRDVDDVEDGIRFLESGEDHGEHSAVGVFVNGEPVLYVADFGEPRPPTLQEKNEMIADYKRADRR